MMTIFESINFNDNGFKLKLKKAADKIESLQFDTMDFFKKAKLKMEQLKLKKIEELEYNDVLDLIRVNFVINKLNATDLIKIQDEQVINILTEEIMFLEKKQSSGSFIKVSEIFEFLTKSLHKDFLEISIVDVELKFSQIDSSIIMQELILPIFNNLYAKIRKQDIFWSLRRDYDYLTAPKNLLTCVEYCYYLCRENNKINSIDSYSGDAKVNNYFINYLLYIDLWLSNDENEFQKNETLLFEGFTKDYALPNEYIWILIRWYFKKPDKKNDDEFEKIILRKLNEWKSKPAMTNSGIEFTIKNIADVWAYLTNRSEYEYKKGELKKYNKQMPYFETIDDLQIYSSKKNNISSKSFSVFSTDVYTWASEQASFLQNLNIEEVFRIFYNSFKEYSLNKRVGRIYDLELIMRYCGKLEELIQYSLNIESNIVLYEQNLDETNTEKKSVFIKYKAFLYFVKWWTQNNIVLEKLIADIKNKINIENNLTTLDKLFDIENELYRELKNTEKFFWPHVFDKIWFELENMLKNLEYRQKDIRKLLPFMSIAVNFLEEEVYQLNLFKTKIYGFKCLCSILTPFKIKNNIFVATNFIYLNEGELWKYYTEYLDEVKKHNFIAVFSVFIVYLSYKNPILNLKLIEKIFGLKNYFDAISNPDFISFSKNIDIEKVVYDETSINQSFNINSRNTLFNSLMTTYLSYQFLEYTDIEIEANVLELDWVKNIFPEEVYKITWSEKNLFYQTFFYLVFYIEFLKSEKNTKEMIETLYNRIIGFFNLLFREGNYDLVPESYSHFYLDNSDIESLNTLFKYDRNAPQIDIYKILYKMHSLIFILNFNKEIKKATSKTDFEKQWMYVNKIVKLCKTEKLLFLEKAFNFESLIEKLKKLTEN